MTMNSEIAWRVIDSFFDDNPNILVKHHLASYNDFIKNGIKRIFKEKNPIVLQKEQNPEDNTFNLRCELYMGGKQGNKLYFGKPVIYDDENNGAEKRVHFMYPNEARLRNMTYGTTIHYDVDVEFIMRSGLDASSETVLISAEWLYNSSLSLYSRMYNILSANFSCEIINFSLPSIMK